MRKNKLIMGVLKLFSWDKGNKPYWVNPENGLEWYVDKHMTSWCDREHINGWEKLNAVVFYVLDKKNDGPHPMERILIDKESNNILAIEKSLEVMIVKINTLRMSLSVN